MTPGRSAPLEALSKWAQIPARAEQICFAKEALRLAARDLSHEQASIFWLTLRGATEEERQTLREIPAETMRSRLYRARSFMRRACAA